MKYRARCNKRACQARKTIKGVYDPNDRVPCHKRGCKGLMRIDVTRERDCTKDASNGAGLCQCDGISFSAHNRPHRKGTKGCKHYDDMIRARNLAPRSKHSPIPAREWIPF